MENLHFNNVTIPAMGFGTYLLHGDEAFKLTLFALKNGYRHIDTAQIYNNEEFVGSAISSSGISRDKIFLTTKIWVDSFTENKFMPSLLLSLKKLKTEYVDLFLLHWPNQNVSLTETIPLLNEAYQKGYAKNIGVSNFNIKLMEESVRLSQAPIVFNQIEYQPYLTQDKLVQRARELNINIMGHSSMANGAILKDPIIKKLAEKYKKDPAQILFRWLFQMKVASLMKSTHEDRILSNAKIFDFELSADDLSLIKMLSKNPKRFLDPASLSPVWDN